MAHPNDFEAYLKGYEDAMRAAGNPDLASPSSGAKKSVTGADRDIGGAVGRGLGTAFGWLILFPMFMGLMAGTISWVLGLGFTSSAVGVAGLALVFAVFAGAAILGFRVFLQLWPVVVVVVVVVVIFRTLID